jgi:peptide/nickel transport system substrate-binding protein
VYLSAFGMALNVHEMPASEPREGGSMNRWSVLRVTAASTAALVVAGSLASARGSTLRLNALNDVDFVDPALSYYAPSWQFEYATCLKLLNYADAPAPAGNELVPDAARALPTVSSDGRAYTFRIRRGLRFSLPSDERVDADTFKHALERVLTPSMGSPGAVFFTDIVGAQQMLDGSATSVSGIVASRQRLTITLVGPRPDFLARLAMPFACAVPRATPATPAGAPLPSAGPYFVSARTPGASLTLTRNPRYTGPRPHAFDQIVYTIGVPQATSEAQIEADQADYAVDGLPPEDYAAMAAQYGPGTPHQQFFVNPILGVQYLALNTSRPMMAHVRLRKAVNYAIDRPALIAAAGAFAGTPTDQILPPEMFGFADVHAYPLDGPNLDKARHLARGLGGPVVLYTSTRTAADAAAHLLANELAQIGLAVDIHEFPRPEQIQREGTRGEPFDIGAEGWIADFADPFDFINVLLDGRTIKPTGNNDLSYFDNAGVEAAMDAAAATAGQARADAYAALDAEITTRYAPWAAYAALNERDFVSAARAHVVFQPVYGLDLAALRPSS